jgi:UDP-N-acetylmuramoyl-tripeptide--D-alanyl-D-alanine ligase
MRLSDLVPHLQAKTFGNDAVFHSVSIDTRTLKPGDLFIALKGEHFDGHDFIKKAEEAGAIAALVSQEVTTRLPLLQVSDTRIGLGKIAAYHRQQFSIPFLAHTGSNGKTTSKEMIASILRQCGSVLATQGNLNNDLGVPLTLMNLNEHYDFAVIELGANHPGEIAYTSALVQPRVAMITNIAPAHTEGFGGIEGVALAKSEIYESLGNDGIAIINRDDAFFDCYLEQNKAHRCITFGINPNADFTARNPRLDDQGLAEFDLCSPIGSGSIRLNLPGEHNISNALAAAASAYAVGASIDNIQKGLASVPPTKGRLNVHSLPSGARLIDDSYNANPGSVKAAITFLARFPSPRIFVLGDMGELGDDSDKYHIEIGQFAKQCGVDIFYGYGRYTQESCHAFGKGAEHFLSHQDLVKALIPHLAKPSQGKKTCLIKGSLTAKMGTVVAECLRLSI